MTVYDRFDAEYDEYCRDRAIIERESIKDKIQELDKSWHGAWSVIQFYTDALDRAQGLDDKEAIRKAKDILAYEQERLQGYEAEMAKLEEKLSGPIPFYLIFKTKR